MRLGSAQEKHHEDRDMRPGARARRKDRERSTRRHRSKMRRMIGRAGR